MVLLLVSIFDTTYQISCINDGFFEPKYYVYSNQFMYETNIGNETTKFSQQSVGTLASLANLTHGRMSVLALNAGPNISLCCVVYVLGRSAYRLHGHYHYHHSCLRLLGLFHYQLPRSVCCPALSAQLTTCVSPS